jgi:hypothetical protein
MGSRCWDGETRLSTSVYGVIRGLGYADGLLFVATLSGTLRVLSLHGEGWE